MKTMEELMRAADTAVPVKSRGKWRAVWPVFCRLMTNGRGHDCLSAVEWLASQKAIPAAEVKAAHNALRYRWHRLQKKEAA